MPSQEGCVNIPFVGTILSGFAALVKPMKRVYSVMLVFHNHLMKDTMLLFIMHKREDVVIVEILTPGIWNPELEQTRLASAEATGYPPFPKHGCYARIQSRSLSGGGVRLALCGSSALFLHLPAGGCPGDD